MGEFLAHRFFRGSRPAALALAALFMTGTALAQKAPTDVKSFGDWSVRCFPGALPPCEMQQASQARGGRRLMSISIAFLPRRDRYALRISTPLGIAVAKGVKIAASGYAAQAVPFHNCDRGGCYARGMIEKGALDALGRSSPKANLAVTALDGRVVQLAFSLRGFAPALAAMEDLARHKVAAAVDAPRR